MTERKQKILLYIYLFYFLSPVIFDKNLLDFNIMQNLLYSILNIILIILILIFKLDIKKISINALILAGILLFPAMMLISSFLNSDYLLVQKDFLNYINITIFFFITVIILNSLSDKEFSRFVLPAVFIASIIIILFGFLQASGLSIQGIIRTDRPGSTLSNRTFASEYIATTFPVAAYFLFCEVNKDSVNKYKVIQFSLILTIFISYLILLRTRAAFFCIIFTLLFFLVILIIRKKKFSFTIKSAIVIILIFAASVLIGSFNFFKTDPERKEFGQNIETFFQADYNALRVEYLKASWKMFIDNPLTGIGTGKWFGEYPATVKNITDKDTIIFGGKFNDEQSQMNSDLNSHNVYAEILCENGIPGLITFLFILIPAVIFLCRKSALKDLYKPYLLCLLNIMILFLFSFTRDSSVVMIIAFLTIGLAGNNDLFATTKFKLNINIKYLPIILLFPAFIILIFNFLRYTSEKRYISALKYKANIDYINMNNEFDKISNFIYPVDVNNMPLDFYRGVGYYERREYDSALKYFKNALNLASENPVIKSNIASTLYKMENSNEAILKLQEIRNKYPDYIEPRINLVSIYTNNKNYDSAKILINEIDKKEFDKNKVKNYFILEEIKEFLK